jgi:hypothetical protein
VALVVELVPYSVGRHGRFCSGANHPRLTLGSVSSPAGMHSPPQPHHLTPRPFQRRFTLSTSQLLQSSPRQIGVRLLHGSAIHHNRRAHPRDTKHRGYPNVPNLRNEVQACRPLHRLGQNRMRCYTRRTPSNSEPDPAQAIQGWKTGPSTI